jgi:type IV pilus assembly protein PilE
MPKSKQQGFTLIEVLITVAIVAILSAIAIPSYQDYVKRGRIVDSVSTLANMQASMEQFFQDNRTYTGACGAAGTLAALPPPTKFFTFSCPTRTATGYQIVTTGSGAMAGFSYDLSQAAGVTTKTTVSMPSGWSTPPTNNCWALKKDGSC